MITILKKLRNLPVLGLLAAAAVLALALGCGGSSSSSTTGNSSFTVDISDTTIFGGSKGSVAITVKNASPVRFIKQITFIKSDGTEITKNFDPAIPPGGSIAGVVLYTAPGGNWLGSVTASVVASDSTGRFSQGFNMKVEFGVNTVTLTPSDGVFNFQ